MKLISLFTLLILLNSCQTETDKSEQLIFARIEFIYTLKPTIARQFWKDFDHSKFDLPLIYYTKNASYIANPTKQFLRIYKPKLVYESDVLKIYKTLKRYDDVPFHMESSYSIGDKDRPDLGTPIMHCSSFEVTIKTIPETKSIESWAMMIIHEYFHGFQYKHPSYLDATLPFSSTVSEDSLGQIFKDNDWFEAKMKRENDFLLKAIDAKTPQETKENINSFFILRKERRAETLSKLKIPIEDYEKMYETMEGTARYIEFKMQSVLGTMKPNQKLVAIDPSYRSNEDFKNYSIKKDPWMYEISQKRYFYSTGFNMIRLLDKMKIDYKSRLFNEGKLSLEELLLKYSTD